MMWPWISTSSTCMASPRFALHVTRDTFKIRRRGRLFTCNVLRGMRNAVAVGGSRRPAAEDVDQHLLDAVGQRAGLDHRDGVLDRVLHPLQLHVVVLDHRVTRPRVPVARL